MKILYLCPDLGIPVLGHKGASVHVRELASALTRAGKCLDVFIRDAIVRSFFNPTIRPSPPFRSRAR